MNLIEATANGLLLEGRFLIDPKTPLPAFNTATARAFVTTDTKNQKKDLYALVCDPWPIPQIEMIKTLQGMTEVDILQLPLAYGVAQWPGMGYRLVIILRFPEGPRFMPLDAKRFTKIEEEAITGFLLKPAHALLQRFEPWRIAHRNIRPNNLLYNDVHKTVIIFGENVSAPPGYNQPSFFEPLERALAVQEARGTGGISDDLFALGMTTLCLLLGQYPSQTEKVDDFLEKRLRFGSFKALIGKNTRLSPRLLDLLEGLLADKSSDRWTLKDLDGWIENQRRTRSRIDSQESTRAFVIEDYECYNGRMLAQRISRDWGKGCQIISKDNSLEVWIRRGLKEDNLADRINNLIRYLSMIDPTNLAERDRILSQICIMLDEEGPIRWESLVFMPDGFHHLIAKAYFSQQDVSLVREIFLHKLIPYWSSQNRSSKQVASVSGIYDSMYLPPQEDLCEEVICRLMYKLTPGLPCLSPMLKQANLLDGKLVLQYIEANLEKKGQEDLLSDVHVLAFLVSSLGEMRSYPLFVRLSGNDIKYREKVRLFADIQKLYDVGPLPKIAQHLITGAEGVWKAYKNLQSRQKQKAKATSVAEHGNLVDVLNILNDTSLLSQDRMQFEHAQQEYAMATKQIIYLRQTYLENMSELSQRSRVTTTFLTIVLGAVSLIFNTLYGLKGFQ